MSFDLQYSIFIALMYLFLFLFGVCVGSFLNVCIYRLPKEESLTKSNSHCMTCGTPILKRDLIPIVSWCMLRGKCRACKAPISPRYTIVEALNGLGWLLIGLKFDMMGSGAGLKCILCCLVFSALVVVFFMDWDTQLISTYVVAFIAVVGVAQIVLDFIGVKRSECSLKHYIIGFFAVSVPMLLITLISKEKAMGMGDVYLMAAAGLFLGVHRIVAAFFVGVIIAAIAGLILKKINGSSKFAFGPWLSIGIFIVTLWGWDIVNLYMNFTGLAEILYGEGTVANLPLTLR